MLSNAYFLAKFRFDTAENEPAKNLQKFTKRFAKFGLGAAASPAAARSSRNHRGRARPWLWRRGMPTALSEPVRALDRMTKGSACATGACTAFHPL